MSEDELKKYHHFKMKTSDGIELDLIETKYYKKLLDLYKKTKYELEGKEALVDTMSGNEEVLTRNYEILEEKLKQEKEKNRQSKMRIVQLEKEIDTRIEDVNTYYISKNKIKAKIKELEEEIHIVIPNEYNKIEVMNEFKNEGAVDVLKELLED